MKIHWEIIALDGLDQVADYILDSFGEKIESAFRERVQFATELLKLNPYMGVLDPLLSGRSQSYRSILINRLSKMVYYVDEKEGVIHISAFWDCRCEPLAQSEHLK